jgi:hypothetical protein
MGGASYGAIYGKGWDVLEDVLRPQLDELGDDPLWWGYGGAFAALHFGANRALELAVIYHRNGKEYEAILGDERFDFEFEIDYISIPLLIRNTSPRVANIIETYSLFGPYLDVKVNAEAPGIDEFPASVTERGFLDQLEPDNIDDEVNPVDFGFMLGLGIGIKSGPGRLRLELRGAAGLVDVFDNDDLGKNVEEIKNAYLLMGAGYALEF